MCFMFSIITGGNYSPEGRNLVNFHISTTAAFPSLWRLQHSAIPTLLGAVVCHLYSK